MSLGNQVFFIKSFTIVKRITNTYPDNVVSVNNPCHGKIVDQCKHNIILKRIHRSMESMTTTCRLTSDYDWLQLNFIAYHIQSPLLGCCLS